MRHVFAIPDRHLVHVGALALTSVLALLALGVPGASAQVPDPVVVGPIAPNAAPGDPSHAYTFFSSEMVGDFGYVEEEFFLEGVANAYDIPPLPPPPLSPGATATIVSSGHPYRTRIVVRRPRLPSRFNGTVVLEWLNVSGGFDLDSSWQGGSAEHYMRAGYVWVGVSAQLLGIHAPFTGLRAWSPTRYGTLDVTAGGTFLADELSWDIFSQAAQAVMSPADVDPLAGLRPERIIATGASQSAVHLGVYHNRVHPLANVIDGFMLALANPVVRADLATPVFKLHSETDAADVARGFFPLNGSLIPPLQDDSDTLRTWQVAGSSHLDATSSDSIRTLASRDSILLPPPGLCAVQDEGSRVRLHHVANAAYDHLSRWARSGVLPPIAPLIETDGLELVRDERGFALGGIRIADQAVPIAVHTGENSGPFFCTLLGASTAFEGDTLAELYPDHGLYVVLVEAVARGNVADGYITRQDAVHTTVDAAQSDVGR